VGILKRLRGTPIIRHDAEWQMIYNPHPPYEILGNRLIDFATLQRLRRFARYWDLVGNSGNFVESVPLIWSGGARSSPAAAATDVEPAASNGAPPVGRASSRAEDFGLRRHVGALKSGDMSPHSKSGESDANQFAGSLAPPPAFAGFLRFSDWLHARTGRTDSIALVRLMELLFEFLTVELKLEAKPVAEILWRDYQRGGRHDKPGFMKDYLTEESGIPLRKTKAAPPKRQARHLV